MRVSYSGYYATLPWLREGFDSPYPLIIGKAVLIGAVFLLSKSISIGLATIYMGARNTQKQLRERLFFWKICNYSYLMIQYS